MGIDHLSAVQYGVQIGQLGPDLHDHTPETWFRGDAPIRLPGLDTDPLFTTV